MNDLDESFERIREMWRVTAQKQADLHPDCPQCQRVDDLSKPSHFASERCESGKYPHCTCDRCY